MSGLQSHRKLYRAFALAIALQVLLVVTVFGFSVIGKQQTSNVLAFDAAAARLSIDFERVSTRLQSFYKELTARAPSQPYVEMLQRDLGGEIDRLNATLVTLFREPRGGFGGFGTIDPESEKLLTEIKPPLDAFINRANTFVESSFEVLQSRYARPSVVELAAARTGRVRRSLEELAQRARQVQEARVDRLHAFITTTICLSLLLLLVSWRWIIEPALTAQRRAIIREAESKADLSRKNTELQLAEARALTLYEEARRGIRSRTEFLAVVSHELRTPLNAVIGFSELMRDETFGKHAVPTYREYSADIHKSGVHLLSIVEDILEFTRYESNARALEETEITAADLFDDLRAALTIRAQESGIELRFDPRADQRIRVDRRLMLQALVNLGDNAIKFSPDKGRVAFSAVLLSDGEYSISVLDTGIGIKMSSLPRLLKPFEQVESAFSRTVGGLGLGLAITQKIITDHEGRLDVESEPGLGSCFSLILPAGRVSAPHVEVADALSAKG